MLWITLSAIVGRFFINSLSKLRCQMIPYAIGFGPQDVNLVTALLVVIALILPKIKSKF